VTLIEHGVPLARLTTIGTGGPAAALARPKTLEDLTEALRFAESEELEVVVVGLGSNMLAADEGVDALVLRLEGELAAVETSAQVLSAGGGATNAVCLHRARDAGLGGFEFACAIPGTAGGGVRMNAGAYGRDWSEVLVRALVVTVDDDAWLTAEELGLEYRHSSLSSSQVVARVEYRLEPRSPSDIRETVAELVGRRKATQPTNKRTFGSVFKNPVGDVGAGRVQRVPWRVLCLGPPRGGRVLHPTPLCGGTPSGAPGAGVNPPPGKLKGEREKSKIFSYFALQKLHNPPIHNPPTTRKKGSVCPAARFSVHMMAAGAFFFFPRAVLRKVVGFVPMFPPAPPPPAFWVSNFFSRPKKEKEKKTMIEEKKE